MKVEKLLANWDNAIVDLNRGNGLFVASDVRLRNCSLHYSEACDEYYVRYGEVTYGAFDIYNMRINKEETEEIMDKTITQKIANIQISKIQKEYESMTAFDNNAMGKLAEKHGLTLDELLSVIDL